MATYEYDLYMSIMCNYVSALVMSKIGHTAVIRYVQSCSSTSPV